MGLYRITNILPTSVTIEDIGAYLPCRGSSIIVDENIVHRSRDLNLHKSWVRVEHYKSPKSIPIWPFSKPVVKPTFKPLPKVSKPQTQAVQISIPDPSLNPPDDLRTVCSVLGVIAQRMQVMTDQMAKIASTPTVTNVTQVVAQSSYKSDAMIQTPQELDPIFIPSQILPQKAQTHIITKENDIDGNDVNESMEVLRKMRKS